MERAAPTFTDPVIEFCGEVVALTRLPFVVGREGDLVLDADNRFLHRRFVSVERRGPTFVLVNIGDQLTATVADSGGHLSARLSPGGVLPLLPGRTVVGCAAGPTSYEFTVWCPEAAAAPAPAHRELVGTDAGGADATVRRARLSPEQKLALVVLAEPVLLGASWATGLPSNADAAARLGWSLSKYNRKLDNLCVKFAARGVRGLRGGPGQLASYRRARLVEFAIGTGMVSRADLGLLP